jgi:hypothetical protein
MITAANPRISASAVSNRAKSLAMVVVFIRISFALGKSRIADAHPGCW